MCSYDAVQDLPVKPEKLIIKFLDKEKRKESQRGEVQKYRVGLELSEVQNVHG